MRSGDILHRIIFMVVMNELEATDKPHKNDDLRMQQAKEGFYYAARFWPGYWICKDNTSKDPFSQCESPQGIRVQVKNE